MVEAELCDELELGKTWRGQEGEGSPDCLVFLEIKNERKRFEFKQNIHLHYFPSLYG